MVSRLVDWTLIGYYCRIIGYILCLNFEISRSYRIRDETPTENKFTTTLSENIEYARVACGKQITPNRRNLCKSVADNGF